MAKKYKMKKGKEKSEEEDMRYSRFVGKYARSHRKERTPAEKKEYKKLALFLIGWTILLSSVYYTCITLELRYTMLVYEILGLVLFFVWLVFNGGFKKIDVTKFEKPDDMGYDEYCAFIDKLKERQRKSKYFLILFMPFFMIMLVDYLIIIWFP